MNMEVRGQLAEVNLLFHHWESNSGYQALGEVTPPSPAVSTASVFVDFILCTMEKNFSL